MVMSYKVLSVDPAAKTMIVEFDQDGDTMVLNVPIPAAGVTIDAQVQSSWPSADFARRAGNAAQVAAAESIIGQGSIAVVAAAPTPAQTFASKIAAGCAVVSTATVALSATYPIDPVSQGKLTSIVTGINAGKGLPHGAATVQWPDVTGTMHNFAPADIVNLGAAIEGYIYDLIMAESALAGGHGATWPTQPLPIA